MRIFFLIGIVLFWGCSSRNASTENNLFSALDLEKAGITFFNQVNESDSFNIVTYEYLYNGGGVAMADFNNDGLTDIYLSGNEVPNHLYLNKGDWKFEEIAQKAGVQGRERWKTGVSVVDINGDGRMDIYQSYSGPGTMAARTNQLFVNYGVNNGQLQFKEEAAQYGLDAPGTYTTHMVFFDMDRDNDLDAFMVNHADMFYNVFYNTSKLRRTRHPEFGNRLYRNDGGRFTDISESAGIDGSGLNFGLSAAVGDVNNDGWPDIYVANDYNEQDFLYINNQSGGFKDVLQQAMGHISQNSMGTDIADLNNDGLADIVSLDMLPEDHYRQKLLKGSDGYDIYQLHVDSGFHHQQMRNMLQLNQGVAPDGIPRFSEIGQFAGISNTDWSWAPVIADFDNDGWKDLYITNGFLRDFTNMNFLKFTYAEAQERAKKEGREFNEWEVIKNLSKTEVKNYFFKNLQGTKFSNVIEEWGVGKPSISTGAAYGDLDNDGDLDLVVNNINQPLFIWRNQLVEKKADSAHYIRLQLLGSGNNKQAIGAVVSVYSKGKPQYYHHLSNRGFQSSHDPILHIGLGKSVSVDSMDILWPDGHVEKYKQLKADSLYTIKQSSALEGAYFYAKPSSPMWKEITQQSGVSWQHQQTRFVDFKQQPLLLHQISKAGPFLTKADVNRDGMDDFFVGGNQLSPSILYLQWKDGQFKPALQQPWQQYDAARTGAVHFFDADADGDQDLYLAKLGNDVAIDDGNRQHRLYLNDGKGAFTESKLLPSLQLASMAVISGDVDGDGDLDLFVGGRHIPTAYPFPPDSKLLINLSKQGKLQFVIDDKNEAVFKQLGMVTAAGWLPSGNNSTAALVVAGEGMAVTVLRNENGVFKKGADAALPNSGGWWCSLQLQDVNADGLTDIIAGNAGTNMQVRANANEPATLWYGDFDKNGMVDPFLNYYIQGKEAPAISLDDAAEQIPSLKKQFLRYDVYANAGWKDIFSNEQRNAARYYTMVQFNSVVFIQNKNGSFQQQALPDEIQWSPLQTIVPVAEKQWIVAGNYYPWRIQWGKMDAGLGRVLKLVNDKWQVETVTSSGLWLDNDTRSGLYLKNRGKGCLVFAANEGRLRFFAAN